MANPSLGDLTPNPRNPRKISKKKLEMLRESMAYYGDLSGIIQVEGGDLVGGHQRVEAFRADPTASVTITERHSPALPNGTTAEGYVEMAGSRFSYRTVDWDQYKATGAALAANKGAGEWEMPMVAELMSELDSQDFDLDLTLFDEQERRSLFGEEAEEEPSGAGEEPFEEASKTDIVPGDLYALGNHLLRCGDSAGYDDVYSLMGEAKAALIFTDPPYNQAGAGQTSAAGIRKSYANLRDSDWDQTFSFDDVSGNLLAFLATDASVYVCTSQHLAGAIWDWMSKWATFHSYCVWVKPSPMPSLHKRHWTWATELICYATRGNHTFNFPQEGHALSYWNVERNPGGNKEHPTMKPTALPERAILHSSKRGDIVLDLFGGAGSTLLACEATGRLARVQEMDPRHCQTIINRWEKMTGQQAELIDRQGGEDPLPEPSEAKE